MQEYIEFAATTPMLVAAWFGLAAVLIFTTVKSKLSPVKAVTHQEATQLINKQDAVVVDMRSKDDFRKGHIVDSKNITESQINDGSLSAIEKYKDSPIIVVCSTGMRASAAANKINKAGFDKVSYLSGGVSEWKNAHLPLTKN